MTLFITPHTHKRNKVTNSLGEKNKATAGYSFICKSTSEFMRVGFYVTNITLVLSRIILMMNNLLPWLWSHLWEIICVGPSPVEAHHLRRYICFQSADNPEIQLLLDWETHQALLLCWCHTVDWFIKDPQTNSERNGICLDSTRTMLFVFHISGICLPASLTLLIISLFCVCCLLC